MARDRWFFKSGDAERGPYSAHQLERMVETGAIHPKTLVRKGNRYADRSKSESDGWKEAQRVAFLARLFERGRTQRCDQPRSGEASPPASTVDAFAKGEESWRGAVAAARDSGEHDRAIALARQGIREHPRSDWLWLTLGGELIATDRLDEAEAALKTACRLNSSTDWLWRYLARLHRKRGNLEKEIEALEKLHGLGMATWQDLTYLGIAYHNHRNLPRAVHFYHLAAGATSDATPWLNLGLVFNDLEMSQDVDAADAYRRALAFDPGCERAKTQLETTRRKLVPLAAKAHAAAAGLLNADEVMQFYISPFEALQIDGAAAVEELDLKVIQRCKQRLLQELDLNDSKVSWLEDYSLDRSRALNLDDELLDEDRRRYHWAIFQNKHLLRFLTHGVIDHFLYSEDYFPRATLDLLECEPAFRTFLSKPFARQYNRVLTRAIERQLLPVVEVLFDGRRWVEPEDDDICFEGATIRIGELVELMRGKVADGCALKASLCEVENFLSQHSFVELFNLLPAHFAPFQKKLVEELRSLAISCFKTHGDSALSRNILGLCNRFKFRSIELSTRLKGDFEDIEKIIREEEKHSFSALIQTGQTVRVTRGGIQVGREIISESEVRTIRWGVFIRTVNGTEREHSFSLVVGSSTKVLRISWDMRGLFGDIRSWFCADESSLPISQQSTSAQEACFERMIAAVFRYLVPGLVMRLIARIEAGQTIAVGPCKLSSAGVGFSTSLLFQTDHLRPWHDVDTHLHRGEVHVFSRANRSVGVSMSAKDTNNAVLLPILCAEMRERMPARQAAEKPAEERAPAEREPSPLVSEKSGLLGVAGIVIILIILAAVFSMSSSKPASTPASGTPSTAARPPAYSAAPEAPARASESKWIYRVPPDMKAELDQESEAIEREKATAAVWGAQLERLSRELERDQAHLNHTSQYEVDQFNRKVDAHNTLLERVKAQEGLVNRMVELYNAKLEQYGR